MSRLCEKEKRPSNSRSKRNQSRELDKFKGSDEMDFEKYEKGYAGHLETALGLSQDATWNFKQ